ncbi:hypothetical protein [Pseudidiomarina sediminum]|uniref:hypothetical protein n=1 Tax=Pseudidiomarina sediminum TaxID=431675 RepID=UPI001C960102|nr:hypothetical protein [Pseudidiomarina sediminum]MBY6065069.1 hypothetical protein [Pseudidiomarina sediminum]
MKCFSLLIAVFALTLTGCRLTPPMAHLDGMTEQQRNIAIRAYQQGDFHTAQGIFLKLTAPTIADAQSICFLAAIYYRQHEYQAALNAFSECQQHYPQRQEVWLNAAATHIRIATELLLAGKSYQHSAAITDDYQAFLQALLRLQGMAAVEARQL